MNININEIFPSIQGEGYRAGQPAIFVRTQGCHVGCEFCDTRSSWQTRVREHTLSKVEGVISVIEHWKMKFPNINLIVITGGEPFEQLYAVHELVMQIKNNTLLKDMIISFETSGAIDGSLVDEFGTLIELATQTEITLSPKVAKAPHNWFYTWAKCVKLLVGPAGYFGPGLLDDIIKHIPYSLLHDNRVFFQPLDWGNNETIEKTNQKCLELSLQHGFPISAQVHKFLKYK